MIPKSGYQFSDEIMPKNKGLIRQARWILHTPATEGRRPYRTYPLPFLSLLPMYGLSPKPGINAP